MIFTLPKPNAVQINDTNSIILYILSQTSKKVFLACRPYKSELVFFIYLGSCVDISFKKSTNISSTKEVKHILILHVCEYLRMRMIIIFTIFLSLFFWQFSITLMLKAFCALILVARLYFFLFPS